MELKKGQFVRTNKGVIQKIKTLNTIRISTYHVRRAYMKRYGPKNVPGFRTLINGHIDKVDIIKSSKKELELVEMGDVLRLANADSNTEFLWLVENEDLLREVIIDIYAGELKLLGVITKERLNEIELKTEEQ